MQNSNNHKAVLSTFSLIFLTIGAVDSVRNLPSAALFGTALIFYFLIAGFTFLIPSGLVSAELASTWNEEGGVYLWAKQAFNKRIGIFGTHLCLFNGVCGIGIIGALFTIVIGFICPANIACSQGEYILLLLIGIIFFCSALFLLNYGDKKSFVMALTEPRP